MLKVSIFFISLICLGPSFGLATLTCGEILQERVGSSIRETPLRFMSYNVLNLYLHKGKYVWGEDGLERTNQDHLPKQKSEEQTQGVAKAILELHPDFLVLQEVEGVKSLERFNRDYLGDEYEAIMTPTNDTREIGIALLVRKNLGLRIEMESFVHRTWRNPRGESESVFTRNFPVFKIYKEGATAPSLILGGVHLKSQRDRKGDPRSFLRRQAELREAKEILEEIMAENPQAPVIVMGDFNTGRMDGEVSSFFDDLYMTDPHLSEDHFDDVAGLGLATHSYHPHTDGVEQEAVISSIDRAFLSKDLVEHLMRSAIYRYRSSSGAKKPIPSSLEERDENPSDHFPIYFDLEASILFN